MIVRIMSEADLEQVSRLEEENFSQPWSKDSFKKQLESKDSIYVVAEQDGFICGVCGVIFCGDYGEIMNVSVHKNRRREGIASDMLRFLICEANKRGCDDFTLEVRAGNASAIRLYEGLGFKSEGIRPGMYSQPIEDGIIYWRRKETSD